MCREEGGVAERSKALVLKTSVSSRNQGFESLPLRQSGFLEKYPRGRRGSPAKGVGWLTPARGFKSLFLRHFCGAKWCNGSTADSDSVSLGSSPSFAASAILEGFVAKRALERIVEAEEAAKKLETRAKNDIKSSFAELEEFIEKMKEESYKKVADFTEERQALSVQNRTIRLAKVDEDLSLAFSELKKIADEKASEAVKMIVGKICE